MIERTIQAKRKVTVFQHIFLTSLTRPLTSERKSSCSAVKQFLKQQCLILSDLISPSSLMLLLWRRFIGFITLVSVSSYFDSLLFLITSLYLPPSSVQLLQDAQASEGQVVVLECRVRGSPPLQVRWYRQGEEILDSPDFRILQKSQTLLLVIPYFQL